MDSAEERKDLQKIQEHPSILCDLNFHQKKNLLDIAAFNHTCIEGLFPENYSVSGNKNDTPVTDGKSRTHVDWMEKGVCDALRKKYLKTLLFSFSEGLEGPSSENYAFSFRYLSSDSEDVVMSVSRRGNKKDDGAVFKTSVSDIVQALIQLMRNLDHMPKELMILVKLLYHDDVTPTNYEPPFFRGCSEHGAKHQMPTTSRVDGTQDKEDDFTHWIGSRFSHNVQLTDFLPIFLDISVIFQQASQSSGADMMLVRKQTSHTSDGSSENNNDQVSSVSREVHKDKKICTDECKGISYNPPPGPPPPPGPSQPQHWFKKGKSKIYDYWLCCKGCRNPILRRRSTDLEPQKYLGYDPFTLWRCQSMRGNSILLGEDPFIGGAAPCPIFMFDIECSKCIEQLGFMEIDALTRNYEAFLFKSKVNR